MATSGDAELLLIPRVDYEEMRRTANRMSDALERATEQASLEMQRDLRRGVGRGINDGIRDGEGGFSKLKGKIAAIGIGAAITSAVMGAIGNADEFIDKVAEKADKIRAIGNQSNAFGIDKGTYASMTITGQALGLEVDDIKGLLEGWNEGLTSDDTLVNYANVRDKDGLDEALLRILYTASTKNEKEAHGWLASEGTFGSDATFLMPIVAEIKKLAENGESITWDNLNKGVGIGVSSKQYSEALGLSEGNAKGIALADAKLESNSTLSPITKTQQQAYSNSMRANAELERAQMATISERVKMQERLFELEMFKIKQATKVVEKTEILLQGFKNASKAYSNTTAPTPDNPDAGSFRDKVDGFKNGLVEIIAAGIKASGNNPFEKESPMDINKKILETNDLLTIKP